MRIPVEFYEHLRSRINLSDIVRQKVTLTKKAGEYLGICPFHQEKTPSFTVNDIKRFYHCFGCAAHGDVIKFVSETSGLAYKDAAIKLAEDYGIELPKLSKAEEQRYEEADQVYNILELASEFFENELTETAINYLTKRNINQKTISEFSIGFAPKGGHLQKFFATKSIPLMLLAKAGLIGKREDGSIYEIFTDRIIFPIRNIYNKVVGFGGRVIGDGLPKYINSPETIVFKKNETLYGENKAIAAAYKKDYAIIVEGYLDVIALHKAGFHEAMASLGTAITEGHLHKLWRSINEIIICLNADDAGIRATKRVINLVLPLINHQRKISFMSLPPGQDPDEVIKNSGNQAFQKLIDNRTSLSQLIWQIEYNNGKGFSTAEAKTELERNLEGYCTLISDKLLKNNYSRYFKEQLWENLFSKRKNTFGKVGSNINISTPKYSELEFLEYGFFSLLIKYPEIISEDKIKDFFLNLDLSNTDLAELSGWLFEFIQTQEQVTRENIRQAIENTRFKTSFLLLSKENNLFLDTSFVNKTINPKLLWELLEKKYHLIQLKAEYAAIIGTATEETFKKAKLYHNEIIKITNELQKLNESFTNY